MKKTLIIVLTAIAVVVVAIVFYGWGVYNKIVTANEAVNGQWAQVETQFQRRFDLIPNLVETVKGAMQQEQKVFGDLAEARTRYAGAKTADAKAEAVGGVESAFARLLVVMENYPQLKSVETTQTLMAQLEGTENRVSVERKRFNDLARDFNVMIKRFPAKLFASSFGFSEKKYIQSVAGAENAPAVKF
ncbi:LemA family protein [Patescibacteria group bacterium]|nr:LemA family protein [Patescibacteria group bacterium]MBU0879680.1 LemA family protein [Patescibacteria group bacterium]MBU0880552.1 LemA family protein [Patescibacteria group bacterium]MBU0897723.1 LemA family protein [Patescibacteria group bacterium]MBU1062796.1 LemA family protein [Patescibacteria group bacterium]